MKTSTTDDAAAGEDGGAGPRNQRIWIAATCHAALFLFALYFGGISIVLPSIGASFHLGSAVEGRLFPASFSGFVVGVLLCGYLSDRWGRKAVLMAAMGAYAVGLLITSIAPLFPLVLLASALIGAGSGAIETVASALAADLYPERRAILLNAVQIAFGAGAAIGPYLAHEALSQGQDWRTLYLILATAQLALLAVFMIQRVPRHPGASEAVNLRALGRLASSQAFLGLCLAQALYVGAEVAFAVWMPTYFRTSVPGGSVWEGIVVTVFWVAMTIGRIGVGPLIGRMPLLKLTILLAVCGAIASSLVSVWTAPWTVICCVALTGLCFSGIFGLILAEAGALFPTLSGSAFGGITASGGVGGAILPWAVALVAGTGLHWRGALLLVPAANSVMAIVLLFLGRSLPRRAIDPEL